MIICNSVAATIFAECLDSDSARVTAENLIEHLEEVYNNLEYLAKKTEAGTADASLLSGIIQNLINSLTILGYSDTDFVSKLGALNATLTPIPTDESGEVVAFRHHTTKSRADKPISSESELTRQ